MRTIGEYLAQNADTWPEKLAYVSPTGRFTWAATADRARRLARGLCDLGLRPGDVVAILSGDSQATIDHWFACALGGFVRTGINYRYAPAEVAHILADCQAKAVVVQGGACEATFRAASDAMPDAGIIAIGTDEHDLAIDYEKLLASASDEPLPSPAEPDPVLAISYTSGTTGRPKGARWRHQAVLSAQHNTFFQAGFRSDDVFMHCSPAAGVPIVSATWNVLNGAAVVLEHDFTVASLIDTIERERVTATLMVPTLLHDLLGSERLAGADTSSLRLVVYGSASVSVRLIRAALDGLDCELQQWYGSTEGAGGWYTILRHADHLEALAANPDLLKSAGRPFLHYRVAIVDDDGAEVPRSTIGNIAVQGPTVFDGYVGNPEATNQALRDGWLHTGDVGSIDERGYLYIADRKHDLIITGGYNVYPFTVENVIADHPGVASVCVVGVPHERWGQEVCAAITVTDPTVDPAAVSDHCRANLARFEVPKRIRIVDDLPRGSTGKILRRSVIEVFEGP